jgi:hypothetical protein
MTCVRMALAGCVLGGLGGCVANAESASVPEVPAAIATPHGVGGAFLAAQVRGTQLYRCGEVIDGEARAWRFIPKETVAILYEHRTMAVLGEQRGPSTWQFADGSNVEGVVLREASPDSSALPWQLFSAVASARGGLFSEPLYVQRLHTVGGRAPSEGCDEATAGELRSVAFSAEDYFFDRP